MNYKNIDINNRKREIAGLTDDQIREAFRALQQRDNELLDQ